MSTKEKAISRVLQRPKDYTYKEAKKLLEQLGFKESSKGKTSGSRVKFFREADRRIVMLHKPHPGDTMTPGAVRDLACLIERLESNERSGSYEG